MPKWLSPDYGWENLRNILSGIGVQRGSPLEMSVTAPQKMMAESGEAVKDVGRYLTKAPPLQEPRIPALSGLMPKELMGTDIGMPPPPTQTPAPSRGRMDWNWGSQLGEMDMDAVPTPDELAQERESFLSRGQQAQAAGNMPWQQLPMSDEQLDEAAWRSPNSLRIQAMARERFGVGGDITSEAARERKRAETLGEAETGMSPAVLALQELKARQAAYPNEAYAGGLAEQADIGAQQRLQSSMIESMQRGEEAGGRGNMAMATAIARILSSPSTTPEDVKMWTQVLMGLLGTGMAGEQ